MAHNYTDIQLALDTQVQTVVGLPTIQLENTQNSNKNKSTWTRTTLLPASTEIVTLGAQGYDRLNGLYRIDLFSQLNEGVTDASTMADLVLASFTKGARLTSGSVVVVIENKTRSAARVLDNRYNIPLTIIWSSYQVQ